MEFGLTSGCPRYYRHEPRKGRRPLRHDEPQASVYGTVDRRLLPLRSRGFQMSDQKNQRLPAYALIQLFHIRKSWISSGKINLFESDMLLPQPLRQIHCLPEWNIAVVVAVNQQDGRFPG